MILFEFFQYELTNNIDLDVAMINRLNKALDLQNSFKYIEKTDESHIYWISLVNYAVDIIGILKIEDREQSNI